MSGETRCQRCGRGESAPAHYYFDPDEGELYDALAADARALREQRDEALSALGIRPDEEGGWVCQNGWCRDLSDAIEHAKRAVASEAARAVRAALHPSTPTTPRTP